MSVKTDMSQASKAGTRYVPALRWKKGEILAMRRFLRNSSGANIAPLLLVDNVAERKQNETAAESARIPIDPKKYIDFTASEMQKLFNSRRAFVDTSLFDSQRTSIDGLTEFFSNAIAKLSPLVPVLRLGDSNDRLAVFAGLDSGKGVALRLVERDFYSDAKITDFLRHLGLNEENVDLIADLGYLEQERADIEPIADLIQMLAVRKVAWRSITLLAGAYPAKPAFPDASWMQCARFEWSTYAKVLRTLRSRKALLPSFGDYGIINPNAKPTSGSGGGGGSRPIIRYCAKAHWRIRRAPEITRKGALSRYFDLARECAVDGAFMGRNFSFGDSYIDERAMGHVSKGGNPSSYISVDTNHHLAFVVAQLTANLPAPQPRVLSELPPTEDYDDSTSFDQYWEN